MRFAWACLTIVGCGFPNVTLLDGSVDATIDSATTDGQQVSDAGSDVDADSPPLVTAGCKMPGDCTMSCTGKPGTCGCAAYLVDSAAPFCDTLCGAGCLNKSPLCTEAGMCILQ